MRVRQWHHVTIPTNRAYGERPQVPSHMPRRDDASCLLSCVGQTSCPPHFLLRQVANSRPFAARTVSSLHRSGAVESYLKIPSSFLKILTLRKTRRPLKTTPCPVWEFHLCVSSWVSRSYFLKKDTAVEFFFLNVFYLSLWAAPVKFHLISLNWRGGTQGWPFTASSWEEVLKLSRGPDHELKGAAPPSAGHRGNIIQLDPKIFSYIF